MVCAGRATSRMRKENGARPDFLTRRMRAPASPDEEIFPSLLFLITCRSILTVRASRATIGKSETSPDGLRDLKRDALRTLGFREDSKMSMIINESLRLYPPVIQLVRKTGREVRLGKFILPANIQVLIPNVAFHHDPQIWGPEAQLFKPERFSEGVAKATRDNMAAFLPFGMGPRICVGFNFATTETKIALSMILQRYTFTLSPGYVHSPLQFLTVRPQHGVQADSVDLGFPAKDLCLFLVNNSSIQEYGDTR
ncbi:hypothetical protein ACLB2K_034000 [Fragaria x ananassa]